MQDFIKYDPYKRQFTCRGEWSLASIVNLQDQIKHISWPVKGDIAFDGSAITKMDSAGAWLLSQCIKGLIGNGLNVQIQNFSEKYRKLLSIIAEQTASQKELPKIKKLSWLERVGQTSAIQFNEARDFLAFTGNLAFEALRIIKTPKRIRIGAVVSVIDKTGYQALPIIGLLSLMIGIVIAYQMGVQLRNYGANIFIVDFLGLAVLREFGPLLTAIMVAGRTGSSFTAQIGTMKVNQEIDALNVMGVTPAELLLLPRLVGLVIALPLLTIWADVFGIAGGMMMAKNMLDIGWQDFLIRFQQQIPLRTLIIGLGKAPVFALIIASIGCFEGMQVKGSADSVGKQTTRSVVWAIFFIIVADAIFSVIFSKLGL